MRLALVLSLLTLTARASEPPPASPLLPQDHWAVKAAGRLHEVGLLPEWLPAQRAVPLAVVGRALESAAARAGAAAPRYGRLARRWAERFAAEFSGSAPFSEGGGEGWKPALLGGQVALGYQAGSAREAALGPPAGGPAALHLEAPRSDPFAEGRAAVAYGPHLAAGARLRATPWQADLPEAELIGAVGRAALSVGRTQVGYGPSEVGGVVASGAAAIDRVELMTTAPVRLPGPLDLMGDFALDLTLTRFSQPRHPYHPLLWEFALQWRPHPRLTLGAIRGVMFGGALWEGIPTSQVPLALFGIKNYRENNVYSGSIELRLPTEALLPLTAKVEWGSDDNPGAAFQWPGLVAGLTAPMLPGLPAALGVEYAYFGRGPFGFHEPFAWYAHGQYTGGWATGQTPLGDPLGGNGRALRLTASADPFDARARFAVAGWVQDRFADNLYAPAAGGRSLGIRGEVELRLDRASLGAHGTHERGRDGWTRSEFEIAARLFF